jgi:hypothetical protein
MYPEVINELLLDMYGNYVVQKALAVSNPEDQQKILNVKTNFTVLLIIINFLDNSAFDGKTSFI